MDFRLAPKLLRTRSPCHEKASEKQQLLKSVAPLQCNTIGNGIIVTRTSICMKARECRIERTVGLLVCWSAGRLVGTTAALVSLTRGFGRHSSAAHRLPPSRRPPLDTAQISVVGPVCIFTYQGDLRLLWPEARHQCQQRAARWSCSHRGGLRLQQRQPGLRMRWRHQKKSARQQIARAAGYRTERSRMDSLDCFVLPC